MFCHPLQYSWTSFVAHLVKNPPALRETWVRSLGWEDPLEKGKLSTPVFWPREFHGLCSPWGRKESATTEQFHFHFATVLRIEFRDEMMEYLTMDFRIHAIFLFTNIVNTFLVNTFLKTSGQILYIRCKVCACKHSQSLKSLVTSDSLWPYGLQALLSRDFPARILKLVAIPSSRGSSRPRDWTGISCTAGIFFTTEPLRKPWCKVSCFNHYSENPKIGILLVGMILHLEARITRKNKM